MRPRERSNTPSKIKKSESLSKIPNPPFTHDRSYSWWYLRHYVCVQHDTTSDKSGDEKFKELIIQDYSAWTLFVSLLMTVDMSALLVFTGGNKFDWDKHNVKNNHWDYFYYLLSIAYILLFSAASVLSTLAAYSGIRGYNYYNGIPSALIYDAIGCDELSHPNHYAHNALYFTFLGGLVGVFYCFDFFVGLILTIGLYFGFREYCNINSKYISSLAKIPILKLYFQQQHSKSKWNFGGTLKNKN